MAVAKTTKKNEYQEATGRRKTAVARVRLMKGDGKDFAVNEKPIGEYFQEAEHQRIAKEPFEKGSALTFNVSVKVKGGGVHAQAVAVRQGIARALVQSDEGLRSTLKNFGFLTRDPRMRERKKFGLKRARRARQWRKR